MKRVLTAVIVCGLMISATAFAGERRLFGISVKRIAARPETPAPGSLSPAPLYEAEAAPAPMPADSVPPAAMPAGPGTPVALFSCVKYKDERNIAPCAVTKIVEIVDPCHDPNSCCPPKCVAVQICVPPCGCLDVKCSKDGHRVKYDYGKYEVVLTSRRGTVTVNYND